MMARNGEPERIWKTYKRADGKPIWGEYGWVDDLEFFEGDDWDYLEVTEETWQLVGTRPLILGALERWCHVCGEDVTLAEPVNGPVYCQKHIDGPVP
jgi:hypothetical protein